MANVPKVLRIRSDEELATAAETLRVLNELRLTQPLNFRQLVEQDATERGIKLYTLIRNSVVRSLGDLLELYWQLAEILPYDHSVSTTQRDMGEIMKALSYFGASVKVEVSFADSIRNRDIWWSKPI